MTEPMHDLLSLDELDRLPVVPRGFYQRPTEEVARDLLGKILVRRTADGTTAVRIVEVESYLGIEDPACHTFGGRRTQRTETMWGPAGVAYVYMIYGLHSCLNVVTVGEGVPEAVLIRAGAPVIGCRLIRSRRGPKVADRALTDGPGKLCSALAVTREDDGVDLCAPETPMTVLADGQAPDEAAIVRSPRVGVDYAGAAAEWPLRLCVKPT